MRARAFVAALSVGALAAGAVAPATAAPLTSDPAVGADLAAAWLATQVNDQGFVPLPTDAPNVSATLEVALALASARAEEATFDRIVAWTEANVGTAIVVGGNDDPGRIGLFLMLARTAALDPTSYGGVNLVDRLAATLGDLSPGLYGMGDPTYDGVFRQAQALQGLHAAGVTPPVEAIDWLVDQQCGASPAASTGGYLGYRADTSVDCPAPDPDNFMGPDTNGTALAVQALARFGRDAAVAAGLDFLATAEAADGGIGFIPGTVSDPNSETLAVQAIIAGGEDPTAGRWARGADNPLTALLAWQVGDNADPADQGALASPYSGGFPDQFATRQGVWGLAGTPFPLLYEAFPDDPAPTTPTTSPSLPPATPVVNVAPVVTPRFAG